MKVGTKVYTVKDNYELGDNIQSKVMTFTLGLFAEIERDLISQHTKEALTCIKASGCLLRRIKANKNKTRKNNKINLTHKLQDSGFIVKKLGSSFGTLNTYTQTQKGL